MWKKYNKKQGKMTEKQTTAATITTTTTKVFCTRKHFKRNLLAVVFMSGTICYLFLSTPTQLSWPRLKNSPSWLRRFNLNLNFNADVNVNANDDVYLDCDFPLNVSRLFSPIFSVSDCVTLRRLQLSTAASNSNSNSKPKSVEILEALSDLVQNQLERLQNSTDCLNGGYTLHCGHSHQCGFACTFHHRVACVAISYSMGIPLIHDSKKAWPFSDPWEDAFLPLGSAHCPINNKTIHVTWRGGRKLALLGLEESSKGKKGKGKKPTQFELPIAHGVPMSGELGLAVEEHAKYPFLWMIGQFTKYTMKLSEKQQQFVDEAKETIGFFESDSRPKWNFETTHEEKVPASTVGLHVRRTDKRSEAKNSFHKIDVYMKEAEGYFQRQIESEKNESENENQTRTVFVASDDHTVLLQVRDFVKSKSKFKSSSSSWKIIGVEANETQKNQKERTAHLRDIVRDIVILSDCDFVICGLTSNVCRLVLEMQSYKDPASIAVQDQDQDQIQGQEEFTRLKTLDGGYRFGLLSFDIPQKLILVDT